MGYLNQIYKDEALSPILTDRYHLTTAYGYWREGRALNPATFYMFGRKETVGANYTVVNGLEGVLDVAEKWRDVGYTEKDAKYIRSLKTKSGKKAFPEEFITDLLSWKFRFQMDAAPEGAVVFPQEPLLRSSGPLALTKMLESVALGIYNGAAAYASQAARQADAVELPLDNGSPSGSISVQGMRRGPGVGAMIESNRALVAGGYTTTSTGTAAKFQGVPFIGTMDHAWIMTHKNEIGPLSLGALYALEESGDKHAYRKALTEDAFRSFVMANPESGILLIDTYDPLKGLENAITVFKEMRELGMQSSYGVRFDSGDVTAYSKIALRRFAEEGFVEGVDPATVKDMSDAQLLLKSDKCYHFVAASDSIDEFTASEMRKNGAFIWGWGIGTAAAHVTPAGFVLKVAEVFMDVLEEDEKADLSAMTPVMKVAEHAPVKSSNPGTINSRRYYDEDGKLSYVKIYDEKLGLDPNGVSVNLRDFGDRKTDEKGQTTRDLLIPVLDKDGNTVMKPLPQVESFPGSGEMVTDLSVIRAKTKAELATLPAGVRTVQRPRDEVLKRELLKLFKQAKAGGTGQLNIDVAAVEKLLPPELAHVPVYIDANLFAQRQKCEQSHGMKSSAGVGEYHERIENAVEDVKPAVTVKRPARKFGK